MAQRETTGVHEWRELAPPFTDDELDAFRRCLGRSPSDEQLSEFRLLRQHYLYFRNAAEHLPAQRDIERLRQELRDLTEAVSRFVLRTDRDPVDAKVERTLGILHGTRYHRSLRLLGAAAYRLRETLDAPAVTPSYPVDLRSGHAVGLRVLLWFLDEPVDDAESRGRY